MTTRDRIVAAAMRLFGERGYAATSIAQIESAAGLAPGSGGLYKHFRSKQAVLETGVRERIEASDDLTSLLAGGTPPGGTRDRLYAVALAGLSRLNDERHLNRILVRDLQQFPVLLEEFRTAELARNHSALTGLLQLEAAESRAVADWSAVAAILIDSVSHYWLLTDLYGQHPLGIAETDYLAALADLAARACEGKGTR